MWEFGFDRRRLWGGDLGEGSSRLVAAREKQMETPSDMLAACREMLGGRGSILELGSLDDGRCCELGQKEPVFGVLTCLQRGLV